MNYFLTSTTDSKIFWKTAKQFLNLGKSSSSIPTLKINDRYAEDDLQKANLLNTYNQKKIDDNNYANSNLLNTLSTLFKSLVKTSEVSLEI